MAPLAIQSVAVPIIGADYLADKPGYTPINTFIQQLVESGANDVRLIVSSEVYDHTTDNQPDPALRLRPTDADLTSFASQLKAAGLHITLAPFVSIDNTVSGGAPDSDRPHPSDPVLWLTNHTQQMVSLARLAQQIGADRFVVFSDEVQHLVQKPELTQGWLSLIDQVRGVYGGTLTTTDYNDGSTFANGAVHSHAQLIPKAIWDKIDLIGIGLFPDPFTNSTNPSVDDLTAAWHHTANGLDAVAFLKSISDFYGKPVWISDRPFHSFDGDNVNSGLIFGSTPLTVDQQEQADQYEAFFHVWSQETSWMQGVSFQNYNRLPDYTAGVARFLDSPYGENVQGKLAEQVLQKWFADDLIDAGAGADTIHGGNGHDLMRGLDGNDEVYGDDGNDTINGNRGEDLVRGGDGADSVLGGQGNDLVHGDAGDDVMVNGNIGVDTVHGGTGADSVYGGQGDDQVYGDEGDDFLSGDLGNDTLTGGAGADHFAFRVGSGADWVADFNGGEGDRIVLPAGVAYTLTSESNQVVIDLGNGDRLGLAGVSPGAFNSGWIVSG